MIMLKKQFLSSQKKSYLSHSRSKTFRSLVILSLLRLLGVEGMKDSTWSSSRSVGNCLERNLTFKSLSRDWEKKQKCEKCQSSKRYMHPMFTATLFTWAKAWKQPECPLTEEWIKKIRRCGTYIYIHHYVIMEYYSAIKKNEIILFATTGIDLQIVILSVYVRQKSKYHMILLIHVILKNGTNEPIYKTEIESQM